MLGALTNSLRWKSSFAAVVDCYFSQSVQLSPLEPVLITQVCDHTRQMTEGATKINRKSCHFLGKVTLLTPTNLSSLPPRSSTDSMLVAGQSTTHEVCKLQFATSLRTVRNEPFFKFCLFSSGSTFRRLITVLLGGILNIDYFQPLPRASQSQHTVMHTS